MKNKELRPYHVCGSCLGKTAVYDCEATDIIEAIKKAEEYGFTNINEAYLVKE